MLLNERTYVPPGKVVVHFANSIIYIVLLRFLLSFLRAISGSVAYLLPMALMTPMRYVSTYYPLPHITVKLSS